MSRWKEVRREYRRIRSERVARAAMVGAQFRPRFMAGSRWRARSVR